MSKKIDTTYDIDEGLLDRIVDTIAGKSSKAGQHAKNLKAFFHGDKDAIGDPKQAEDIRKFERNIHRIKEKFDKLIEELGEDLVSAFGTPDEGPFKEVIDEFDTAVSTLRDAIDKIAVKTDSIDDALPPAPKNRFSREAHDNKTRDTKNKSDDEQESMSADEKEVAPALEVAYDSAEFDDPFSDYREDVLSDVSGHPWAVEDQESEREPLPLLDLNEKEQRLLNKWKKIIS
jgi:enolase